MAKKEKNVGLPILRDRLKSDNLCGLYLFTGEETFNKDYYISRFRAAFDDNPMAEFNVLSFDGKETGTDTMLNAIESYPVMAEQKLIIIKNSGIFKSVSESDKDLWSNVFKNPPDYAVIIFDESETDGRSSLLKAMKESGLVVVFDYLDTPTMQTWVKDFLKKRGYEITPDALSLLLSRAGEKMGTMHSEMNKLIDYLGNDTKITSDHILTVVPKSLQDKIFDMLDAIIAGKRQTAFSILTDLKLLREEPAKIIPLIGNSVTGIMKAKLLLEENSPDIYSAMGVAPFLAKKYIAQAKITKKESLKTMLSLCLQADKAIKTENKDKWIVLETLMTQISAK